MTTLFSKPLHFCTTLLNHALLIITNLKWACKFLFHHSLFQHRQPGLPEAARSLRIRLHERPTVETLEEDEDEDEDEDNKMGCLVCLCSIEEGDEVKELRCEHVFHSECLERWTGYRHHHATCPLCRHSLAAPPRSLTELREEVIVFKFTHFSTFSDRDGWWWLR